MAAKPSAFIAAVLKEIPGADSTREQRVAWLRMIALAMDNVYGVAGTPLEIPQFLGLQFPPPVPDLSVPSPPSQKPQLTKPRGVLRTAPVPRFYIDRDGTALRNFRTDGDGNIELVPEGEPLFAHEIGGETLYDDRGELGDLGSIVWADGSRGVLGKRLNISATPVSKAG